MHYIGHPAPIPPPLNPSNLFVLCRFCIVGDEVKYSNNQQWTYVQKTPGEEDTGQDNGANSNKT